MIEQLVPKNQHSRIYSLKQIATTVRQDALLIKSCNTVGTSLPGHSPELSKTITTLLLNEALWRVGYSPKWGITKQSLGPLVLGSISPRVQVYLGPLVLPSFCASWPYSWSSPAPSQLQLLPTPVWQPSSSSAPYDFLRHGENRLLWYSTSCGALEVRLGGRGGGCDTGTLLGMVRERGTPAAGDAAGSPGGGDGECWAGSGARKNLKTSKLRVKEKPDRLKGISHHPSAIDIAKQEIIKRQFETHSSFSSALLSLEAISSGIPVSPSAVPRGDLYLRSLNGGCIKIRVC